MPMIETGQPAPDIAALDHDGHSVRVADYRGKYVLLWFYPKADTPG